MASNKMRAAKALLNEINDLDEQPKEDVKAESRAQQKKALEQADLQECLGKIEAALKDHNCELFCTPQITPDGRLVASAGVQNRKG